MLKQIEVYADYVQIDIMDGCFVPSRSITWEQIQGIPTHLRWEAHLMVKRPEQQFANYQKAGAGKVIFHYEATQDTIAVIEAARKIGLQVGLAINPETPVEAVLSFAAMVDNLLFLSVHPGFYGAQFIPAVLDKIAHLHHLRPELHLGIDGGIKADNIARIALSGVQDIFVGSAIFLHPDPARAYSELQNRAREAVTGLDAAI